MIDKEIDLELYHFLEEVCDLYWKTDRQAMYHKITSDTEDITFTVYTPISNLGKDRGTFVIYKLQRKICVIRQDIMQLFFEKICKSDR